MTSALEDIKSIGISQWLTLATAPNSTKLQPGQTPYAYNVWVDEKPGSVISANGYIKVGQIPSGNPPTFCINYFKTSAGTQTFVVSDNATVWTTIDFQTFTPIINGLSEAFQLRGAVIRDKLWLLNGNDFVRVFDGTNVTIMNGVNGTVVIQDITYTYNPASGISPVQISIAYTAGGTAGSEVVTVTGSAISIQIQTGVSTATQVLAAINASTAALALISAAITGTAGNSQNGPVAAVFLSAGTPLVPKGRYIAYHDERVWIGHISSARSECFFSALSDQLANIITPDDASAWPTSNFLQVSEGDADYLTGLILYRGYLHFFKQYSIWRLVGYDEYTYTRVKTRASTGTRFNESLQILDSLVHMIGIDGLYVFDGEETDRISDIIDPATAEQTSFGFNQLQQPNTNNLFWEVSDTTDWDAGFIPHNLLINNAATLQAADNSEADFQAGSLTNLDTTTNPPFLQLNQATTGALGGNIALGKTGNLLISQGSELLIGNGSMLTDGAFTAACGFKTVVTNDLVAWQVDLGTAFYIGSVTIKSFSAIHNFAGAPAVNSLQVQYSDDGVNYATIASFSVPGPGSNNQIGPIDLSTTFTGATHRYWQVLASSSFDTITITEMQVFLTGYVTSGNIVSRTLDLGDTPTSLGNFFSDYVLNGETLTFQTQTSPDGSTWDSPVSVTNGAAIGSTPRRYIRWIGNFSSDGVNTPVLTDVWMGTLYESPIHDTGGNIFVWGAFEADYSLFGQSIAFYYRGASTSGAVTSQPWSLIVPGGAINLPTTDRYIQFKFEISGFSGGNNPPVVNSVTMNWVAGTSASQPQVLQNVASFFWRNRYWLSAAGEGATANNTILIRGKKTFQSPWQLKDWQMLSFCRYLDNLYGTSSIDGSIYQLDTGNSANGNAINSIFETGDFTFEGFQAIILEIMIEMERLGPYNMFIGTSTDQGQTWTDHTFALTLPTGGTPSVWQRINNINLTTDKLRLRFYTDGVDQPWQVHNCIIYWKQSAQRGTIGLN